VYLSLKDSSGIQFRAESKADSQDFEVKGYALRSLNEDIEVRE
jgi:hypothetical protein